MNYKTMFLFDWNNDPKLKPKTDLNPKSNADPDPKSNADSDKNQTKDYQFFWVLFSMSTKTGFIHDISRSKSG